MNLYYMVIPQNGGEPFQGLSNPAQFPLENIHHMLRTQQQRRQTEKMLLHSVVGPRLPRWRRTLTSFCLWKPICPTSMSAVFFRLDHGVYTTLTLFILQPAERDGLQHAGRMTLSKVSNLPTGQLWRSSEGSSLA